MASASVTAMPMNIVVCIFPAASGFRPMASSARPTKMPNPMPGQMTPKPTASAMPNVFATSISISFVTINNLCSHYMHFLAFHNGDISAPRVALEWQA